MNRKVQFWLLLATAIFLFAGQAQAAENYVICRIDWVSEDSAEVRLEWKNPDSRNLMITGWNMNADNRLHIYYQIGNVQGFDKRMITVEGKSFPVQVRLQLSDASRSEKVIFWDMTDGGEREGAVANLYHQGILGGYPDGSFAPNKNVSRAEFAKILCEALQLPRPKSGNTTFDDIAGNWAKDYIIALADKGLVKGKTERSFDPNGNISLGEIFALLDRSFYLYGRPMLEDHSLPAHWSNAHYLAMKGQAVVKPSDDIYAAYPASRLATRGEVALFLSRILEQKHDRR